MSQQKYEYRILRSNSKDIVQIANNLNKASEDGFEEYQAPVVVGEFVMFVVRKLKTTSETK